MALSRKVRVLGTIGGLIFGLALAFSPARQASAQMGVTWTTGIQVQNLGSSTATITIQLINADGSTAATIPAAGAAAETVAVNGSNTYFPVPNVASGFKGSAIISANQPVAAILNVLGNNGISGAPFYSEAANGISEGSTSVSLPLVQRNNGGFYTWFAVQNTGTADAVVTVDFKAGGAGNNYTAPTVTIKPGAAAIFDQRDDATASNLGTKFVGSAKVTSAQPLAVVVNQVGTGTLKEALIYSGFSKGASSVILPLVQQNNGSFFTGISVQNSGTVAADVTVNYSANLVSGGVTLTNPTATLQPGESKVFSLNGTSKYVGSAVITAALPSGATGTPEVVVIANQTSAAAGSAYEGIDSSTATDKVSLPLLMALNGGFSTGVQCRNLGDGSTSTATTITLTYSKNVVSGGTTPAATVRSNVAVGDNVNIQQNETTGFTSKYVGGGLITTNPASKVVCMVNQLKNAAGAGDAFLTYDGVNY